MLYGDMCTCLADLSSRSKGSISPSLSEAENEPVLSSYQAQEEEAGQSPK